MSYIKEHIHISKISKEKIVQISKIREQSKATIYRTAISFFLETFTENPINISKKKAGTDLFLVRDNLFIGANSQNKISQISKQLNKSKASIYRYAIDCYIIKWENEKGHITPNY